jgi:DNA-binding MarR family transcriptional regulator
MTHVSSPAKSSKAEAIVPETCRLDPERLARRDVRSLLSVLAAAEAITSQAERILREVGSGLRATEWDVLAALYAFGPMRPAELVRKAWMTSNAPTLHAILGRLSEDGLVQRGPHPESARGVLVSLTGEGVDTVGRLFPVIERKLINSYAGHYSDEELDTIAELMERL